MPWIQTLNILNWNSMSLLRQFQFKIDLKFTAIWNGNMPILPSSRWKSYKCIGFCSSWSNKLQLMESFDAYCIMCEKKNRIHRWINPKVCIKSSSSCSLEEMQQYGGFLACPLSFTLDKAEYFAHGKRLTSSFLVTLCFKVSKFYPFMAVGRSHAERTFSLWCYRLWNQGLFSFVFVFLCIDIWMVWFLSLMCFVVILL